MKELLTFRLNLYRLREEREIKPETFSALLSHILYQKRRAATVWLSFTSLTQLTPFFSAICLPPCGCHADAGTPVQPPTGVFFSSLTGGLTGEARGSARCPLPGQHKPALTGNLCTKIGLWVYLPVPSASLGRLATHADVFFSDASTRRKGALCL